jgi:hypothetical protein
MPPSIVPEKVRINVLANYIQLLIQGIGLMRR